MVSDLPKMHKTHSNNTKRWQDHNYTAYATNLTVKKCKFLKFSIQMSAILFFNTNFYSSIPNWLNRSNFLRKISVKTDHNIFFREELEANETEHSNNVCMAKREIYSLIIIFNFVSLHISSLSLRFLVDIFFKHVTVPFVALNGILTDINRSRDE